jgi:hypothetical protein
MEWADPYELEKVSSTPCVAPPVAALCIRHRQRGKHRCSQNIHSGFAFGGALWPVVARNGRGASTT